MPLTEITASFSLNPLLLKDAADKLQLMKASL